MESIAERNHCGLFVEQISSFHDAEAVKYFHPSFVFWPNVVTCLISVFATGVSEVV